MDIIETKRLILRPWREEDLEPFACMNADSRVREYFPSVLSSEESHRQAASHIRHITAEGWGFWAVSIKGGAPFIGFIGMQKIDFLPDIPPTVEIGWRLAHPFWGQGFATEGALASLKYGFDKLHLPEILAFTARDNIRSQTVMKKIGMSYVKDFDHPKLPKEHPLSPHVLYSILAK